MIPIYGFQDSRDDGKYFIYVHPSTYREFLDRIITSCPDHFKVTFANLATDGFLFYTFKKINSNFSLQYVQDITLQLISDGRYKSTISPTEFLDVVYKANLSSDPEFFLTKSYFKPQVWITADTSFYKHCKKNLLLVGYLHYRKSIRVSEQIADKEMIVTNIFDLISPIY